MYVYVGDGYITRPILKPSDSFKAGPAVTNPAGRLDIRPDSLLTPYNISGRLQNCLDGFTTFFKTVLKASQLSCISPSSSSELQLARSHAGDRGVSVAPLIASSDNRMVHGSAGLLRFLAVGKSSSSHRLLVGVAKSSSLASYL